MKLTIERGKHLSANFNHVNFVVKNSDIMTTINNAPLKVKKIGQDKYTGKIFGVCLTMELLNSGRSGRKGFVKMLSDVRLPFMLGRTYTTAMHTYYAIDERTTSIELKLELELFGLMSLYARLRKKSIDDYINRVCLDFENAARAIEFEDSRLDTILDESQKIRICEFKRHLPGLPAINPSVCRSLDASISVSQINDIMLVEADAIMPDKHFISAKNKIATSGEDLSCIINRALTLARINNPFVTVRGKHDPIETHVEFHQAAFELGYKLYREYFGGNLNDVMPVLLHHGRETYLRFDIDEKLQALPWEALHDGKDFIATKMRISRSLGAIRRGSAANTRDISKFGILLIGSNSRGDLPGTSQEVMAIEKILTDIGVKKINVLCETQANRKNVLNLISSSEYNILHFSGHSVFNADSPYQSYLELAQGTKLSLHEIDDFIMPENSKNPLSLVFLNSCQSGLVGTDQITGKNLSLCRMFRESGVDNVIGMLWNVSDEAALHVASVFYKYLATDDSPDIAEIMRKTRLKVAMDRAWQDGSWLAPVLYT